MKIFGREPALWLEFLKAILVLLSVTAIPLSEDQQGAGIAILVAAFGVLTALSTRPWQVSAIAEGIKTMAVSLAVFGFDLGPERVAAIVLVVGPILTLLERGQVTPNTVPAPGV